MILKFIASLTAGFIAAASLAAGARAEQPAPPSPGLVKEIQSRLFELNYAVWPDGNWDNRTKAAIRGWHQVTNRPVSDVMSDDDMEHLRSAAPNKVWGGVVYDSKGHYRLFTNETSRKELVDKEISYCQEGFEAKSCRLDMILQSTMIGTNCTGVSHADWKDAEGNHSTSSTATRPNIKAASDDAVSICAKTAPRENCKLLAAVCADGSSLTGATENKP